MPPDFLVSALKLPLDSEYFISDVGIKQSNQQTTAKLHFDHGCSGWLAEDCGANNRYVSIELSVGLSVVWLLDLRTLFEEVEMV